MTRKRRSAFFRTRSSRPRPSRVRAATPLSLELLEERTLLSTFDVTGTAAHYLASAGIANQVTIAVINGTLTLTDTAETISLTNVAPALGGTGAGTNTIRYSAPLTSLTIDTQDGKDRVTIQPLGLSRGLPQGVTATVTVLNLGGTTDLTIDDSGDGTGQTATLTRSSFSVPGLATVMFTASQLHSLTVDGGNGGNTFTVQDTPGNEDAPLTTTVNSGSGADAVNVQGTTGVLVIDGGGGRDQVTLGGTAPALQGTLGRLSGAVSVRNTGGFTDLVVDDSADPSSKNATLNAGAITGLAPAPISYTASNLGALTIHGRTQGGNTFTVTDTGSGFSTTLQTGTGDTVHILQATGALTVLDADGTDQIPAPKAPHFQHVINRAALEPTGQVSGSLTQPGQVDVYPVTVTVGGFLTIGVTSADGGPLASRLALFNTDSYLIFEGDRVGGGGLLASSDQQSATNANPHLRQYLLPGYYFIQVAAAGPDGRGAYTVATDFTPADNPYSAANIPAKVVVGPDPQDLINADLNRDGTTDLATVNQDPDHPTGSVSVLLGVGDGTFRPELRFPVAEGDHPTRMSILDYNGDGRPDLAAWDPTRHSVDVLLGVGDGSFDQIIHLSEDAVSGDPLFTDLFHSESRAGIRQGDRQLTRFVTDDFNRDGSADQASLDPDPNRPGGFQSALIIGIGVPSNAQATVDYPPVTDRLGGPVQVSTLLNGTNEINANRNPSNPAQAIPLVGDLTGHGTTDGVQDVVEVNLRGQILLRQGIAGQAGVYAPPVLINGPDDPALEIAIVSEGANAQLAAIALEKPELRLYTRTFDPTTRSWTWHEQVIGPTGLIPVRIAAGDLNGDGLKDIVVANAQLGTLSLYLNQGNGQFVHRPDVKLGITISDVVLNDTGHAGHADIYVTDEASGNVGVLTNQRLPGFAVGFDGERRFRAGLPTTGFGVIESPVSSVANEQFDQLLAKLAPALTLAQIAQMLHLPLATGGEFFPKVYFTYSPLQTASVVIANFDGVPDLVVTNRGANNFALLPGTRGPDGQGSGGFTDPQATTLVATGNGPTAVVAGDFNGDGNQDLAILNQDEHTVQIYLGDGHGQFTLGGPPLDAGRAPTGLTAADIDNNGVLDLLVGNSFGDLLVLLGVKDSVTGKGDGKFRPPDSTAGKVAVAMVDGQHFVLGQQAQDQVVTQQGVGGTLLVTGDGVVHERADQAAQVLQKYQAGILAPAAVKVVTVDGIPYLVVANSGENNVLIYRGRGDGTFDPTAQAIAAGTDPVGLTIAHLSDNPQNGPDVLVANKGSNDVSILFGQLQGGNWTLTAGPRLQTGGAGPTSTLVEDVTGPGGKPDGIPDLVVGNSQSNNLGVLPGVGSGFFDDRTPRLIKTSGTPGDLLPLPGDPHGAIVLEPAAGQVAFIPDLGDPATQTAQRTGGVPEAALVGNLTPDGVPDLLVANDNGVFALLVGTDTGFGAPELFNTDFVNPSDLALGEIGNNGFDLFATQAGGDTVTRLAFNLESGIPAPLAGTPAAPLLGNGEQGSGTERPQVGDLSPLNGSTVAIVAVLVTSTREANLDGEGENTAALAALVLTGVSPVGITGDEAALAEDDVEVVPPVKGQGDREAATDQAILTDFLIDLDRVMEQTDLLPESPEADAGREPTAMPQELSRRGSMGWQKLGPRAGAIGAVGPSASPTEAADRDGQDGNGLAAEARRQTGPVSVRPTPELTALAKGPGALPGLEGGPQGGRNGEGPMAATLLAAAVAQAGGAAGAPADRKGRADDRLKWLRFLIGRAASTREPVE